MTLLSSKRSVPLKMIFRVKTRTASPVLPSVAAEAIQSAFCAGISGGFAHIWMIVPKRASFSS